MAKKSEIYKCEICGNIVEVLHGGAGELVCCGQPMTRMEEQTADSSTEKHVPVIEKMGNGKVKVTVGSVPHPMEEKHFIEWIELRSGDKSCRAYLAPGMKPEAVFEMDGDEFTAREYCNIHKLWATEVEG